MVKLTWRFFFGIASYAYYTYFFDAEHGEANRKAMQARWDNLTVANVAASTSEIAGLFVDGVWSVWEGGLDSLGEWGNDKLVAVCFACLAFKALGQFFKKRAERNAAMAEAGPVEAPKAAAAARQKKRK